MGSDKKMNYFFFELQCLISSMALEHTTPITTHANNLSSQIFKS
jgi:hypothetical protein